MAVPTYEELMLPLLSALADGQEHSLGEVREQIAKEANLTEADRAETLPSGGQSLFDNRLGWAKTYVQKAGLLTSPRRAVYLLTDAGKELLRTKPKAVTNEILKKYPSFKPFWDGEKPAKGAASVPLSAPQQTPDDSIASSYQQLRRATEAELLEATRRASPAFFERLVVQLLVKMGYGGSVEDASRALVTGRSGDGGIDGVIKEDTLGLDAIYVQAKRWQANVGRPEVQAFAGSLDGEKARKGVLITTSDFSKEARDFASRIEKRIVLIDGAQLASLMFEHCVGANTESTYEVKRVDSDYFEEG